MVIPVIVSDCSSAPGDAYIALKVIGQQFVVSVSWITARSPCRDLEIPHLGSGTSSLDTWSACWKDTNQAFGVWTSMGRLLSVGATTTPAE